MGLFGKSKKDIAEEHNKNHPKNPISPNDVAEPEEGHYMILKTDQGGKDWGVFYCLNCTHMVGYGKIKDPICENCGKQVRGRGKQDNTKNCKKCAAWSAKSATYCGECGNKF